MVCCPFGSWCLLVPFLPTLLKLVCKLPIIGPVISSIVAALFPSWSKESDVGCCPASAWPKLESDAGREELAGTVETFGPGVKGYVSRPKNPNGAGIVVIYDVFGLNGGRIRTICDALAASGYVVAMPDVYGDEDTIDNHGGLEHIGSEACMAWLKAHDWASLRPKLEVCCSFLAKEGVPAANRKLQAPFNSNRIGMVGFCWGAWVAAKASATPYIKAAVHAHPSWNVGPWLHGEAITDVAGGIEVPTLLMPAADDDDAFRDGAFAQAIQKGRGTPVVKVVDFADMKHGFVPRGSPDSAAVMANVKKALEETVAFFDEHLAE